MIYVHPGMPYVHLGMLDVCTEEDLIQRSPQQQVYLPIEQKARPILYVFISCFMNGHDLISGREFWHEI